MRKTFVMGAIIALMTSASVAQPALATQGTSALSLARASTVGGKSSKAIAPALGVVLGVVGIIAGAVVVVADDEDRPTSP
ncbi:hypothetical protein [Sphingosinithalassobacter portus]|uniref:hypothetical protein n=1 Tax=Stakelama portus TaxID=2676234 RepID=UPI0011AB5530|nr:hypothetical protein [Sphingosinithalassobacter portus]